MLGKLALASGRVVSVCGVAIERTGIHRQTIEPWPRITSRFQTAAADIRVAAMRLAHDIPLVLIDEWTQVFEPPAVFEHPIKTVGLWPDFAPPGGQAHPPRWTCVAWLSSTPIDRDDLTSDLLVGWFAHEVSDLDAEIVAAASRVDWERHARGISF